MARRPYFSGNYGSALGSTANAANLIAQAGEVQGQMYANLGKQLGGAINSTLEKFREKKKEKESQERAENQFLNIYKGNPESPIFKSLGVQNMDEAKAVAKDISKDPQLVTQAMKFTEFAMKQQQAEEVSRFRDLQGQQINQNMARQEDEQEKTTNFLNFLAQPGPNQIDPSGLDRNSVLRNIQAGKGATPPARMIPGPSPAEQSVMSPQAKQFIRRAIQQNQPIDKVLPMAKQIDQEIAQSQPKAPDPFEAKKYFDDSINKMRKEYNSLDEVKAFKPVRASFLKVKKSAEKPSAAGDLALVFNYMKILDPGSVVRESEFKTASDATAWLQKNEANGVAIPAPIAQAIRKLKDGTILTDTQRKDFVNIARKAASAQFAPVKDSYLQYRNIVNQMQLPEGLTLPDNYQMIEDELAGPIPIQSSSNAITTDQGDYTIPGLSVEAQ